MLAPLIKSSLRFEEIDVLSVEEAREIIEKDGEKEGWTKEKFEVAEPAVPGVQFWNV